MLWLISHRHSNNALLTKKKEEKESSLITFLVLSLPYHRNGRIVRVALRGGILVNYKTRRDLEMPQGEQMKKRRI